MKSYSALFALPLLALLPIACGGSQTEPETPVESESVEEADAEQEVVAPEDAEPAEPVGPPDIPTACYKDNGECEPDPKWVEKLCADVYPATAIFLFQQRVPFDHIWMTRKTRAINASGGATSGSGELVPGEELVVLHHRKVSKGDISFGGDEGGYTAMRWDGGCVTVEAQEVSRRRAASPKGVKIPWQYLGKETQKALKQNEEIKQAYFARKKECKGQYSGAVTAKCVQLDNKLQRTLRRVVGAGEVEVPQPSKRPK